MGFFTKSREDFRHHPTPRSSKGKIPDPQTGDVYIIWGNRYALQATYRTISCDFPETINLEFVRVK